MHTYDVSAAQERADAFEAARGELAHETLHTLLHMYAQAGMPEDASGIMARIQAAGYVVGGQKIRMRVVQNAACASWKEARCFAWQLRSFFTVPVEDPQR